MHKGALAVASSALIIVVVVVVVDIKTFLFAASY